MKSHSLRSDLIVASLMALLATTFVQASAEEHPLLRDTSEVFVTVRDPMGMPVRDARVSMHILSRGTDQGQMEIRTDDTGKVEQDIIPLGDVLRLQVFAPGYQPFGTDYLVNALVRNLVIRLKQKPVVETASIQPADETIKPVEAQAAASSSSSSYKEAQWVGAKTHASAKTHSTAHAAHKTATVAVVASTASH